MSSQESVESNSSVVSNTMSDGTLSELKMLVGELPESILELQHEDEPVPSTSQQSFSLPVTPIQPFYPRYSNIASIPSHWLHNKENFPGNYGFRLGFEEERLPVVRASPWTYSPVLKKLYGKNRVDIPIRIYLQAPPDVYQQLHLRVVVMFSSSQHSRAIVSRCRNHESSDGKKHIFESCNRDAVYGTDQNEGHHWVTLPLKTPEVGQQYILEFFKFLCLNTCPGGPDRRNFHAVFLLEQGETLVGRVKLDLKISTTPGRDRPKEEIKAQTPRAQMIPKVKQEQSHQENPQPIVKTEDEENQIFTLQIKGRKRYEELLRINEALEIRDLVSQSWLENYRASRPPSGPNWFVEQQRQQGNTSFVQETLSRSNSGPSTSGFNQVINGPAKVRPSFRPKRRREIPTTSSATTVMSDSSE